LGRRRAWLSLAAPQERRNIQIVVLIGKDRFGQRRADRPDADRALVALGRPVAVAFFNWQAPVAPTRGRLVLRRLWLLR
jgi:hypothetical protein